jgi:hypothetical protein
MCEQRAEVIAYVKAELRATDGSEHFRRATEPRHHLRDIPADTCDYGWGNDGGT